MSSFIANSLSQERWVMMNINLKIMKSTKNNKIELFIKKEIYTTTKKNETKKVQVQQQKKYQTKIKRKTPELRS